MGRLFGGRDKCVRAALTATRTRGELVAEGHRDSLAAVVAVNASYVIFVSSLWHSTLLLV